MPYAAGITVAAGSNQMIEDISLSFSSAVANIRRRNGLWILESLSLDACDSHETAYSAAKELLSTIHSVLSLYMGLGDEPFSIGCTLQLTDDDKLIGSHAYGVFKVNIVQPASQAFSPTASGSLATDVLSGMATDPAIAEALSLVGTDWPRVYDIIEFLGGESAIERSGFAPRSQTHRVRQTANHYRHLGSPTGNPLPSNPPTLPEASRFAHDLLKQWIATRI
jgi:hypothetical protein